MSLLTMSLIFMSCSQPTGVPNEPPVEGSQTPIVQIADTLEGSKGQFIEFHISDYFDSKVPIVNSSFFSEELQITSLPNDSFRVAQPNNSTGYFPITAELTNEDAYELSAELIYSVPPSDTSASNPNEEPANIYQVKNAVNGQQGEPVTMDVMEYFNSEVPIDSVAFQSEQVKVMLLDEYFYEFSQPDDLFGEVKISIFLRNTDQETLSSTLIYNIEKASNPAPITQLNSVIEGQQGEAIEIYIDDYFTSEANFTSTELDSEEITVDSLGDGRFRLSQPEELSGEFRIQAFIANSDGITLEAELMYQIAENSDPAPITQLNSVIEGQQGEAVEIYIDDYFTSEANFISTELDSEEITVDSLGDGRFRLSQPEELSGQFQIQTFITNSDGITLEAELMYQVAENSDPAPITQQKSVIGGQQGETVEIYINDYFKSEANFTSTVLYSEEITVDSLGDGSFRLSQPGELYGEFRIQAFITNSDGITLETELMYQIEENSEPPTPSGDELIIMPLGDSMTNDSRSRVKLWNLLSNDGHNLDYVGNQHQTSSIPDADHEGVGGIKIGGIMDKATSLMQTHSPNYVALMVGTNDIAWYFDETASEIADRWNDLIDRIYASSEPGIYILAATIPPVSSKNVGQSGMSIQDRAIMVKHYNAELRSIIEARKANGDNIIMADMEAALDPSKHVSSDGVHLNDEGYAIMGTVYYDAMNKALNSQ